MIECRICGIKLEDPRDIYVVMFDRDHIWKFCDTHFTLALRMFQAWLGNQDLGKAMRVMNEKKII